MKYKEFQVGTVQYGLFELQTDHVNTGVECVKWQNVLMQNNILAYSPEKFCFFEWCFVLGPVYIGDSFIHKRQRKSLYKLCLTAVHLSFLSAREGGDKTLTRRAYIRRGPIGREGSINDHN